jgi:DNA primase large subunit
MLHLQQSLKRDHHLRYNGRQQFGLFLKGIGVSLEESLKFWRESFQGKIPREKFDKEYAYNIRYNYGKEGKRTDYTPYSCSRIINGTAPGQGEHHGCPFKHFDQAHLREKLASVGISSSSPHSKEILDLVANSHFQVACQRYYMAMHPGAIPEKVGMHPNAYFDESRKYLTEQSGQDEASQTGSSTT